MALVPAALVGVGPVLAGSLDCWGLVLSANTVGPLIHFTSNTWCTMQRFASRQNLVSQAGLSQGAPFSTLPAPSSTIRSRVMCEDEEGMTRGGLLSLFICIEYDGTLEDILLTQFPPTVSLCLAPGHGKRLGGRGGFR